MKNAKKIVSTVAVSATLVLTGCGNMNQNQKDTLGGAAIGAGAGAIIGSMSGHAGTGAAIGAAAGAIGGSLISGDGSK